MQLLSVEETLSRIGISRRTFYNMIKNGFPIKKIGKRTLILSSDIDAYIESLPGRDGEPVRVR